MERRRWAFAGYVAALLVVVWGLNGWWLNRATVRVYLVVRQWPGLEGVLPEHVGIAANVVLFMPLGVWLVHRSAVAVGGLALAVTACVEVGQALVGHRQAEWVDVAANTAGALAGWLLARGYRSLRVRNPSETSSSRNS